MLIDCIIAIDVAVLEDFDMGPGLFVAAARRVIWVAVAATSAATAITSGNEIIIVVFTAGHLATGITVPCAVVWMTINVEASAIGIIIEANWLRIRRGFWLGFNGDCERFLDVGQGIVLQIRQHSNLVRADLIDVTRLNGKSASHSVDADEVDVR